MESRVGGWFDVRDTSCLKDTKMLCYGSPTQVQAQLSSVKHCTVDNGHFIMVYVWQEIGNLFTRLPVLESCSFSLFLLFFLPCGRKNKTKSPQLNETSCWNDLITMNSPSADFWLKLMNPVLLLCIVFVKIMGLLRKSAAVPSYL